MNRDTVDNNNRRAAIAQFIKFGVVGFSNTVVGYVIYYALVYVDLHYLIASVASFLVSVLNSFFWNSRYTFKRGGGAKKRGLGGTLLKVYVSHAFTGLVLNNILLYVLIDALRVSKYIAPLFCLTATVPLNFILNKKWAFKN